jgi:hypothetical protein
LTLFVHVTRVTFASQCDRRGEVQIDIVSPSNMSSRVSEWRSDTGTTEQRNLIVFIVLLFFVCASPSGLGSDIMSWTFVSNAFWHEKPAGVW